MAKTKTAKKKTPEVPERAIPSGYVLARYSGIGLAPLLMHKPTLLDPFSREKRAMQALTDKRKKTVDDEMAISRLDWEAGLYHDPDLGPYIPGKNIKASLRDAAKFWKKGATVTRALAVIELNVPLIYAGPRDFEGLWDEGYRDVRPIVNSGVSKGSVPRCRPCFEDWEFNCTVAYDPEELDFDVMQRVADRAGHLGLLDYRPDFGAFQSEFVPAKR